LKKRSVFIGLLAGLLFGVATPMSKIMLSQLNGFQLAGLLYIGAGLAFLPFIIKNRKNEFTALKQTGKKKHLAGVILFGGIRHSLRKCFGREIFNRSNENAELAIVKLSQLFNHSNPAITRRYLGISQKELLDTYDVLSF
jgi:EamA-like transporter family